MGYYPDGVKRTLTEEQIAIFRHSEQLATLRGIEKGLLKADGTPLDSAGNASASSPLGFPPSASSPTSRIGKKKKKTKGKARPPPEPKPDLRKRTWDVVEKGLDSLDYD